MPRIVEYSILFPVSAAHTSIFQMDSDSTSYWQEDADLGPSRCGVPVLKQADQAKVHSPYMQSVYVGEVLSAHGLLTVGGRLLWLRGEK